VINGAVGAVDGQVHVVRGKNHIIETRDFIAKPAQETGLSKITPAALIHTPVEQVVLNLFGEHVSVGTSPRWRDRRRLGRDGRDGYLVAHLVQVREHLEGIVEVSYVGLLFEADEGKTNLAQEAPHVVIEHCR
jgi:hypothetical protein